MLSGNKGEWSEIYVFFKLLAEGKLNAADANLNAIPNVFYPIIKIIRKESDSYREYRLNGNIKIVNNEDFKLLELPIEKFISFSKDLFSNLKNAKGRSFQIKEIEDFLKTIHINTLKAKNTDKSDITVVVHDLNTGLKPKLGFSIKSMLGGNSTLFNPGDTTNFIYEITNFNELNIEKVNSIETQPKISNRLNFIKENGCKIKFLKIQSSTLQLNLQLIDSDLPQILAELLLIKYSTPGLALLGSTLSKLTKNNPLNFDLSEGHPFYEYKVKNFLTDCALGMTPAKIWNGNYDATGGIIIVKTNGDLVCYHIYNRNEFQNYLINNTKLEQASTKRYNFGDIYEEKGKILIKLNLQIRFN